MNGIPSPLEVTIVAPEQALMIRPFGLRLKAPLTTEATGGAISVMIGWHKPGEGPPDHVHFSRDEIFYIIDGIYELTVGDRTEAIGPGTIVFIPRNVVHRFKNIGDTTACVLDWGLPAGQDHYFQELSKLAADRRVTGEKVESSTRNSPGAH